MFRNIDSAYSGPYPLRIEQEINQLAAGLYAGDTGHPVVLATRYSPENGVDFTIRWPRVYTLLQRDESGDFQLVFTYRDEADQLVIAANWLLSTDEIQLAWLSYPHEQENHS